MKFNSNFKVTAPASIANLICGFDVLGLAINAFYDEITIKSIDKPGVHITSIINNHTNISTDITKNAAGISAQLLLDFLKKEYGVDKDAGLDLRINKKIPVGFGFGSSSASAVAGALAVNEAFGSPLSQRELIPYAAQGELLAEGKYRINSIVPCALGGLFMVRHHENLDYHRLPFPKGLFLVLLYTNKPSVPHLEIRQKLGSSIALEHSVQQSANLGAFIQAVYQTDLGLFARSLEDHIAESCFGKSIPLFSEIKSAALKNNALGCSVAGHGSGIFAIFKNSLEAEQGALAMQAVYDNAGIKNSVIVSSVDLEGASKS